LIASKGNHLKIIFRSLRTNSELRLGFSKVPISILAGPQSPSVQELQDLGVARVSYGSGFTEAAITATRRLAQEILEKGTCNLLKEGMQTPEINALAQSKARK
jgi:2-methylisocitrate lyase-like PEP mutase family enzyme